MYNICKIKGENQKQEIYRQKYQIQYNKKNIQIQKMLQQPNNPSRYNTPSVNPSKIEQQHNNEQNIQIKNMTETNEEQIGIEKDLKNKRVQRDRDNINSSRSVKNKNEEFEMEEQFQEEKQKYINQQLQQELKQQDNQLMDGESDDDEYNQGQQPDLEDRSYKNKSVLSTPKNRGNSALNMRGNQYDYQPNNAHIMSNPRKRRELKQQKQELTFIFSQLICLINNKVSQIDDQCEKNRGGVQGFQENINNSNLAYPNPMSTFQAYNPINSLNISNGINKIGQQKLKSRAKLRVKKDQDQRQPKQRENKFGMSINNKQQQVINTIQNQNPIQLQRKYSTKQKEEKYFYAQKEKQRNNIMMIDKTERERCKRQIFSNYFSIMTYKIHEELAKSQMVEEEPASLSNSNQNKLTPQIYNTSINTLSTNSHINLGRNSNIQVNSNQLGNQQRSGSKSGSKFSVFQEVSLTIVPSTKNSF